ncbi:MAG TPA: hypothetical protein VLC10_01930, partial [Patescibacteria group bacterium]|nr:hypothetical protein [Patescibacteria group bacterium]
DRDGNPVDDRTRAIFERAVLLAHTRHALQATDGARARWRVRRNGVVVVLEASTPADRLTQVLDVEVRWKRCTVFRAKLAQYLLGATPRQRHDFATLTRVPGEWERLLFEARGGS